MKVIRTLLVHKELLLERILILIAALSTLGRLYFVNQYDSQFKLFQYLLIPFLVVFFALPKLSTRKQALKDGVTIGVFSGIPSVLAEILLLLFQYYVLDYRSIVAAQQGRLPEPVTITNVLLLIEVGMLFGFFSLLLCALGGLVSWLFAQKFVPE